MTRGRTTTPNCSPRPRGWSRGRRTRRTKRCLLPAPAGMVPPRTDLRRRPRPAPRARGDGPKACRPRPAVTGCSPRPRGWSPIGRAHENGTQLLPAPAGMVPTSRSTPTGTASAPRARGDGPDDLVDAWGEGLCSPRPRGWSLPRLRRSGPPRLLPAPAGMVPRGGLGHLGHKAAPRARGDGPMAFAGGRGVCRCSPRPRGWSMWSSLSSPRPRGWSRQRSNGTATVQLLPAPAGMVPRRARTSSSATSCSPRPRGWSPRQGLHRPRRQLLPAPAEMVPSASPATRPADSAPRACGDGPRLASPAGRPLPDPRQREPRHRRPVRPRRLVTWQSSAS